MQKTDKHFIAEVISLLANPVVLVIASAAFVAYRFADTTQEFVRWMTVAVGLLLAPGLLYSVVTWIREGHIDIDISNREDRVVPLMLSTLGAVVAGYLMSRHGVTSQELLLMGNVLVAMLICLTIVTVAWKVSLHAATIAALSTLLTLFGGANFAWLFVLLVPVAWSRLFLKQHTPAQLTAGTLIGMVITLVSYKIFGG